MTHLVQALKALADPIRIRILILLHEKGELCVCDIMTLLAIPQSTTSRHLAYLRQSCWVDTRRNGLWVYYSISKNLCPLCQDLLPLIVRHGGETREIEECRERVTLWDTGDVDRCS